MTSRLDIVSTLTTELKYRDDRPGRVIALTGRWGVGKTHLWTNEVLPQFKSEDPITISLFGLESLDDLHTRIATAALLRRGRQLKTGNVTRALAGSLELLKELGSKVAQGVDSYFQTNLLKGTIDPLVLLDDDTLVCLDDIERAGSNLRPSLVLGFANYLAESKRTRVLLILNDEALATSETPMLDAQRSNSFVLYKERTISLHLRLEPELTDSAQFIGSLPGSVWERVRGAVAQRLHMAGHSNIRTLVRIRDRLDLISTLVGGEIPESAVYLLAALTAEDAEGHLSVRSTYETTQLEAVLRSHFRERRTAEQPSDAELDTDRFLGRYFPPGHAEYSFFPSVYELVRTGVVDASTMVAEFNPPAQVHNAFEQLVGATQSRDWWLCTDAEFSDWAAAAAREFAADPEMAAQTIVHLYSYATVACDYASVPLPSDFEADQVEARITQRATLGDTSFADDARMSYGFLRHIWEPVATGYDSALSAWTSSHRESELRTLLTEGTHEDIGQQLVRSSVSLHSSLHPDMLAVIRKRLLQDRKVGFGILRILYHGLSQHLPTNDSIWEGRRTTFINWLYDLGRDVSLENSDRARLRELARQYGGVHSEANPE